VIATWRHPFSRWNPADEQSHEAFRSEQTVMGMVMDGRVVFANQADRDRLAKAGMGR
jgi:branched-chain amino acid transport system substrate-binding protein